MKHKILSSLPIFFLIVFISAFFRTQSVRSVPPANVKDTLSNSQYSYYGGLTIGNTGLSSYIKLDISNSFPSKTSGNLFVGDTLNIGVGGSQSIYIVKDVGNTAMVVLNTGLSGISGTVGAAVIATRSAVHTLSFTPVTNATAGVWQFLLKATSTSGEASSNDKIPDQGGFDLGTLTAGGVTCPFGATASVGTTTAIVAGNPAVTSYYHVVQCSLGAGITSAVGIAVTMTVGAANNMFINPSPSHSALEGNADIFTYILRQGDSNSVIIDSAFGKIAVVEAVRLTATVDPTLTFIIDNIGATDVGSTACGAGTSLAPGAPSTTGDEVLFGSLSIGTTGNQLAQRLRVNTNAPYGYVVTVYESGPMRNIGITGLDGIGVSIPDAICDTGPCTITSAQAWSIGTTSGFGYTMKNVGSSITFNGPSNFKPFGNGTANSAEIMKKLTTPIAEESAYVCYRITAANSQTPGDYEGKVTYTATATF